VLGDLQLREASAQAQREESFAEREQDLRVCVGCHARNRTAKSKAYKISHALTPIRRTLVSGSGKKKVVASLCKPIVL